MKTEVTAATVDDFVARIETGGRSPGGWQGKLILTVAFVWALFQLYVASNLPFWLTATSGISMIITNSDVRLIHLSFGLFLASLAFPLFSQSPRDHIPWYDWLLAIAGVASCFYIIVLRDMIAVRAGLPTVGDLIASSVGLLILGIAVYRALGLPLLIVASVFVCYVFFGHVEWLPEAIQWKGASYGKAMWHYWMQNEGVFGVALGVSSSLIFLFVLFGSILEKAGAGNYFIKFAFATLGHFRGGPAKAAVVASALSGMYSGSSIANTVTTGTFTIPLMKKTGFSAEKAGAVEVASSTNGQLMPPVMGAAAFLIAEFTGISYTEILKHALLPAVVSYIALIYIVHLEAMKLDLRGLPKPPSRYSLKQKTIGFLGGFIGISVLGLLVYYGLGWVKVAAPELAFPIVAAGCALIYLGLVWIAAHQPDLTIDDPDAPITELPRAGETAVTGLFYILPIVLLIWCIVIERLSPGLSALWASIAMTIVALTQHPLKAIIRGSDNLWQQLLLGWRQWIDGMISGARSMVSISVATGAAGIIVGTISLTGAHQVIGEFIEILSGGHLMVMLLLVAVMSLILGMGLPTTANYIVVSSLMAPVVLALGAKSGLIIPLIAVHLFVFYFGILADDTPPVGLAAMAAAAISKGDPIRTGIQGFAYDIRTALLPFMFIFNTELLLIDVTWYQALLVFFIAVVAMMLFAAATQGFMLTRNKWWETVAMLLVAFTLFRPGYWLDQFDPPYDSHPPATLYEVVGLATPNGVLTMVISGPDFDSGKPTSTSILVPLGNRAAAIERLSRAGLTVSVEDGLARIDEPLPGSEYFEQIGTLFDYYDDQRPVQVSDIRQQVERVAKYIFYLPALALLLLIVFNQRRRLRRSSAL